MSDDVAGAACLRSRAAWHGRKRLALRRAGRQGGETRAVGGAVRDALLGLPVADVDFATAIVPDKVMARARKVI